MPKTQRTEQRLLPPPPSKRQKLAHHSSGYIDTPVFWDSLSKIWLTKHALRELNRRNSRPRSVAEQRNIPAADFLRNSAPKRLKDIKRFARHGGPDLSDLVGYPEPIHLNRKMSSSRRSSYLNHGSYTSRSRTSENTTTRKSTSGKRKRSKRSNPSDANYQQKLLDGGIFLYGYDDLDGTCPPLPPDWDEINRRLAQPRPSLSLSSFPEEEYQKFLKADSKACNEDTVKDTVLPAMLEAMGASNGAEKNVLFTNLDPITDCIAQAKPDYYYGSRLGQIHHQVRNELSTHIIPSSYTHLSAVPNFFLEAKGPHGSGMVATLQACHDGAIGARAMQSLRSYGQSEPVYDNNVYTISSTYHLGTLKLYGHSVAQPNGPGTRPEYYMHQLNAWAMIGNKDAFLQGATMFKNAIDLTREYRNVAITQANERAAQTIHDEDEDDDEEEAEFHTDEDEEEPEP